MIRFKRRTERYWKASRGTKYIRNFEGNHLPMRGFRSILVTYELEKLDRFLRANVGRPVNKVFSEYLKRCESSVVKPKKLFFNFIKKKEDIGRFGGFYVTNGILNYKKRVKPNK